MFDIRAVKKSIRKDILNKRTNIDDEYRRFANDRITHNVQHMLEYQQAEKVLYYLDFRGEVSTRSLIDMAWKNGKIVCVPLTIPQTKSIEAYQINSWDDLHKGTYGILEPQTERCQRIELPDIDLVIVPGVAFDSTCNRLGYGGGYYDRLAIKLSAKCLRIALAYQLQIVESVPVGVYDIPVNSIVTESTIIKRP